MTDTLKEDDEEKKRMRTLIKEMATCIERLKSKQQKRSSGSKVSSSSNVKSSSTISSSKLAKRKENNEDKDMVQKLERLSLEYREVE
jgi:uncharacterized membrane protein YcjF (UPF0283 family)